jgi:D-glycero-D-manno-heptose 1,7-bisphosphate phosphatase
MKPRLLILDRDGVINKDSNAFVKSAAEWLPLPGSMEAIGMLSRAGIPVTVASNQSGIGRGLFDRDALYAMHRKMRRVARIHGGHIDRIVFCPHHPDADCDCRKPKPGMLHQLLKAYGVAPGQAVLIGDSMRDLESARAAGVHPVLVLTGNGPETRRKLAERGIDCETWPDLLAYARQLLAERV